MIRPAALFLAATLALSACGESEPPPASVAAAPAPADNCDRSAVQTVAFSAPDAADIVEARSFGPTCANAVVMLAVRRADGAPLVVWSTAQPWIASRPVGDGEQPGPTVAMMDAFLSEWVKVKVDTTASLPEWPQRVTAFRDQLSAFMTTPFGRDEYLDIRAKGAPRLCFATGVSSGQCIYYDERAGAAPKVLDSGG